MYKYQENLYCWYPFKDNGKVLMISDNKAFSYANFEIKNVKEFKNIRKEYDYVILNDTKLDEDILLKAKKLLNKKGHLLIICENELGLKYLANGERIEALTYQEILEMLKPLNYKFWQIYYPYPNQYQALEILTDQSLDKIKPTSITNPLDKNEIVVFKQEDIYEDLRQMNINKYFMNSYIFDLSNENNDYGLDYIKISNNRDKKYQLYTSIDYKNNLVYKYSLYDEGIDHLKKISKNKYSDELLKSLDYKLVDNHLECKLLKGENLNDLLNKLDNNEAKKYIDKLKKNLFKGEYRKQEIDDVFIKVFSNEVVNRKLHWLNRNNVDMVLDNIFINKDKWIVIDNEWVFDFPIPGEFILYRLLNNSKLALYDEKQLIELLKVDEETIDIFKKWDEYFVYQYVGSEIVDYKASDLVDLQEIYQKSLEVDRARAIEQSSIWQMSKPIRDVVDKIKGGKNGS